MVLIENGEIVIRLAIDSLPDALKGHPMWDYSCEDFENLPKIVDLEAFAKEVARELQREEEDGTTLAHKMFDAAIEQAIEMGAEGIDFND
jgi:hypothetical protein